MLETSIRHGLMIGAKLINHCWKSFAVEIYFTSEFLTILLSTAPPSTLILSLIIRTENKNPRDDLDPIATNHHQPLPPLQAER